jgi:hypothetical protein
MNKGSDGHHDEECISEPLPFDERYLSPRKSPEDERERIREYVASQASDEVISHLEKVTTEIVYGRQYDVWDVHTDKTRWWVITLPTNLYSQALFPSMDMCLSFHIGIATRLLGTEEQLDEVGRLIVKSLRRLEATSEALDAARNVEQFQAVGAMLREALLALVRDLSDPSLVPSGMEEPKLGDFIHWSELIIDGLTEPHSLRDSRPALKIAAKDAWQAVGNLTHRTSADKVLADVCMNQVRYVFDQWITLMREAVNERTERCAICESSHIVKRIADESTEEELLCQSCGARATPHRGGDVSGRSPA